VKRSTIFTTTAAVILVATIAADLPAQVFGGGFANRYTSLFDLYRTGKIPIPPYFSLHPPVYYNGIVHQQYGCTPFAYPHNWWQQYGYGGAPSGPPCRGMGPGTGGYVDPANHVIENPHVTAEPAVAAAKPGIILNPYVQAERISAKDRVMVADTLTTRILKNPFVTRETTVVNASTEVVR